MTSDTSDHRQLFDLVERMLEYDCDDRIALGDALRHPYFAKLPTSSVSTDGEQARERSHSISR